MKRKLTAVVLCIALGALCVTGLSACGGGSAKATKDVTDLVVAANPEGTELAESYIVPENVDAIAPCIGSMVQLSAMLTVGDSKIAAAPIAQISDEFKEVLPA